MAELRREVPFFCGWGQGRLDVAIAAPHSLRTLPIALVLIGGVRSKEEKRGLPYARPRQIPSDHRSGRVEHARLNI
jgi:hypothetical protein